MSSVSRTIYADAPEMAKAPDIQVLRGSYMQIDYTLEDAAEAAIDISDARVIFTAYDIEGATNEFQIKAQAVTDASWTTNVATFTAEAHGFVAADSVTVGDCGNSGYDGTFTVVAAPTADTFTAALVGDPGAWTTNGQVNTDEIKITTAAGGEFSVYLTDDETDTDPKTYRYSIWVQLSGGTEHHCAEGRIRLLFSDYTGG